MVHLVLCTICYISLLLYESQTGSFISSVVYYSCWMYNNKKYRCTYVHNMYAHTLCKLWSMYVHSCLSENLYSPSTAEDYDDRGYVVTFDVETQMGMLVVHANEDMILEDPEMFLARLSIPSGLERVVEGDPPEAKITIIDRNEVQVFFDPVMYPIDEGEKAILTSKLTKEVASGVTIVVQYVTQDGSAKGNILLN